MTVTRGKMMAGVLGLSLGGLAAMADAPPKPGKPLPTVCPAPTAATPASPLTIPAPAVTEIALPTAPVVPGPLQIPTADPTPALPPAVVAGPADVALPALPVAAAPTAPAAPEVAPAPRKVVEKVVELTVPASAIAAVSAEIPVPAPVPAAPPVAEAPAPKPAPVVAQIIPAAPPAPTVAPVADPAPVVQAAAVVEKKLRVVLNMGDDRPRFEVKDGEEALLKVVCERVDVKSPTERGEPMSTMKAVGAVVFVTPGGEGTCDELSVVPGTGQVVVTGQVRFKYNWGKVETEVSGDRMTFRLGAAPGVLATGGRGNATATPTSLQRR